MDEILNLDRMENGFYGHLRRGDKYHDFEFTTDGLKIKDTWDVAEFDSYEHFAARIGKWDPDALFLVKPIKIMELTLDSLEEAFGKLPQ